MSAKNFFSASGSVLAFLFYLAPIPRLINCSRTKKVEEISHLALLFSNFTPFLWAVYSIAAEKSEIFYPNLVFFGMSLVYISGYHLIKGDTWEFMSVYVGTLMGLGLACLRVLPINLVGSLSSLMNILGCVSPLEMLGVVLKEKNGRYIDLNMLGAGLLCNGAWAAYGYLSEDVFILVPNFLGILIGLLQIFLFAWTKDLVKDQFVAPFHVVNDFISLRKAK